MWQPLFGRHVLVLIDSCQDSNVSADGLAVNIASVLGKQTVVMMDGEYVPCQKGPRQDAARNKHQDRSHHSLQLFSSGAELPDAHNQSRIAVPSDYYPVQQRSSQSALVISPDPANARNLVKELPRPLTRWHSKRR